MRFKQGYLAEARSQDEALKAEDAVLTNQGGYPWHRFSGEGYSRVHIQFETYNDRMEFISLENRFAVARKEVLKLSQGARIKLDEFPNKRASTPFAVVTFG